MYIIGTSVQHGLYISDFHVLFLSFKTSSVKTYIFCDQRKKNEYIYTWELHLIAWLKGTSVGKRGTNNKEFLLEKILLSYSYCSYC